MRITRWTFNLAVITGLVFTTVSMVNAKHEVAKLESAAKQQGAARQQADAEFWGKIKDLKASLEQAAAAKDKAEAKLAIQNEQIETLGKDIAKASQEKSEAQAYLARYKATGVEPEQIAALPEELKRLKAELAAAQEKIRGLTSKLSARNGAPSGPEVELSAGVRGHVVVVDPKWRFVVLDAGQKQGVVENGQFLVTRNGRLIAKVVVSSVDNERCIANLVTGWEFGDVLEGDSFAPAHPKS